MSDQNTEIIIADDIQTLITKTEGSLSLIAAVNQIIDKNHPEEFIFSCGEWGKHWIKIVYRKGKKIKITTRDNK